MIKCSCIDLCFLFLPVIANEIFLFYFIFLFSEPVISAGGGKICILEDGWTAMSVDQSRSAQFEHTILITREGSEILTV